MKFKDIIEDEVATSPETSMKSSDIAQFGDRIGSGKGDRTRILRKPMVDWKKNRMEVEGEQATTK